MSRTCVLACLLFTACGGARGETYYVDNRLGNDGSDGTAPVRAWRTLARVSREALKPGDEVLLRRGGVWRETLQVRAEGLSGSPIAYGAYDTGPAPLVDGADPLTNWVPTESKTETGAAIYEVPCSWTPPQVFFDGRHLDAVAWNSDAATTAKSMRAGTWTLSPAGMLYLASPRGDSPASHRVEASRRSTGVDCRGRCVLVKDLATAHASRDGVECYKAQQATLSRLTVYGCHRYGVHVQASRDVIVEQCDVYDNHVGIDGNGTPGLVVRSCRVHDNAYRRNSDGVACVGCDGVLIEHNTIRGNNMGDSSDGVQLTRLQGALVRYNRIEGNGNSDIILTLPQASATIYGNVLGPAQRGIALSVEGSDTAVYNNSLYGCTVAGLRVISVVGPAHVRLQNNAVEGPSAGLEVYPTVSPSLVSADHNVYWCDDGGPVVRWRGAIYYASNFPQYQSNTGQDEGSQCVPPGFVDAPNGNMRLTPNSPCFDTGVDVGLADVVGVPMP